MHIQVRLPALPGRQQSHRWLCKSTPVSLAAAAVPRDRLLLPCAALTAPAIPMEEGAGAAAGTSQGEGGGKDGKEGHEKKG